MIEKSKPEPDFWLPDEQIQKMIVGKYDNLEQVKSAFEKVSIIILGVT